MWSCTPGPGIGSSVKSDITSFDQECFSNVPDLFYSAAMFLYVKVERIMRGIHYNWKHIFTTGLTGVFVR